MNGIKKCKETYFRGDSNFGPNRLSPTRKGMSIGRSLRDFQDNSNNDDNEEPSTVGTSTLGAINETEPFSGDDSSRFKPSAAEKDNATPITYRERLGGFLHPRDMRKLVTPFSASNEPELIVRRHAMLLNFDPLRAIVLRDRLIVLVPDGADSILVELEKRVLEGGNDGMTNTMLKSGSNVSLDEYVNDSSHQSEGNNAAPSRTDLSITADGNDTTVPKNDAVNEALEELLTAAIGKEEKLSDASAAVTAPLSIPETGELDYIHNFADSEWEELDAKDWIDLPFELQCADAVLHCVLAILADDVLDLQLAANSLISDLLLPGADFGDHAQDILRGLKNHIKEMTSRVDGFCRALDTLLEDYEDMALMNLSRLLSHPERFIQPVPQGVLEEESDEPELILEAHLQRGHTLKNGLGLVQGQIHSTEDFAIRKSDTIRNRLLYINMLISILSLAVALGSFIGSIFGMNVINGYEDSDSAFLIIVIATVCGAILLVALMLLSIRKVGALPNLF